MTDTQTQLRTEDRPRAHARWGWTLLFVSLTLGVGLEAMEGFRWAPLVGDAWAHRLWSLAHFHGAALGLLHLVYVGWAEAPALSEASRAWASRLLRAGSLALPLGFLLGGIAHPEGDPSLGIVFAPVGAVAVLVAVALQMLGTWRRRG
ncbi:hypothetical protein KRR26_23730 [Corallococcus sp. M34]|uniref:hypothetical protein n=1 Tax=Citreicoccus inhibens TaxID=2849499 RepID=UPI001C2186EE|nr:hypothetical protein [Citreicoccus inhibens]MBU8898625.1 hypothetical protein [Citreicoccus inhibens]